MSVTAAQLIGKVNIDGASRAKSDLTGVGNQAQSAQGRLDHFSRASSDAGQSILSRLLSPLRSAVGGFIDFGAKAGIAIMGFAGLTRAALSFGNALFSSNASMEQTRVAFMAFLQDGKAVDELLRQLSDFAATSPFEFPEINSLGLKLLNMGVKAQDVTTYMSKLGAAVAKVGGNGNMLNEVGTIISQMVNKGKIYTEEMLQLSERNIPAFRLLADAMGIPISQLQKMITNGEMGADKIDLLVNAMGKFGGSAMIEQGRTFNGLLSTLKDNATRAWMAFTGPAFDMAKGGLEKLGALVSSKSFQDFATRSGKLVGETLVNIGRAAEYAHGFFAQFDLTALSYAWDQLGAALGRVLSPLQGLLPPFDGLMGKLETMAKLGITQTLITLTDGIQSVANSLNSMAASGSFSTLISGLQQVGTIVGGQLSSNFDFFSRVVKDLGQWWVSTMQPAIDRAMPGFMGLANALGGTLLPALARLWSLGQQFVQSVLLVLVDRFKDIAPVVTEVGGALAGSLGKTIEFVTPIIMNIIDAAIKFGQEISTRVQPIIERFAPIVSGIFTMLGEKAEQFKPIWEAAWGIVGAILEGAWNFIKNIVSGAWEIVSGIIKIGLDLLSGNWAQAWEDFKSMLSGVWENLKNIVKNGIDTVMKILSNLTGGLTDGLKKPFSDAWEWIKRQWSGLGDILKNIIKSIPGGEWVMQQLKIPGFAEGTDFAPGGMAIVGERGPELVNLPRGAQVIPNDRLVQMSSQPTIIVQPAPIYLDGRILTNGLMPYVANAIRYGVGSVGF